MSDAPHWAMYIDGYNFYYAIKKARPKLPIHLGWCDFRCLATEHIIPRKGGTLGYIKYFTAPVGEFGARGGELENEAARQDVWLRAVSSIPTLEVISGVHTGPWDGDARERRSARTEKETDVKLALALAFDAAHGRFDRAILVTGDTDQIPAVRSTTEESRRAVEIWLPPGRAAGRWSRAFPKSATGGARASVTIHQITSEMLTSCRLPERIQHQGVTIVAPPGWRAPQG
jgi:hypothetical protein